MQNIQDIQDKVNEDKIIEKLPSLCPVGATYSSTKPTTCTCSNWTSTGSGNNTVWTAVGTGTGLNKSC